MANNITPLLNALAVCLCAQFVADERPVCQCCVVYGQEPPPMSGRCDCLCEDNEVAGQGTAWVRFVRAVWQGNEPVKCPMGPWEATLQLGVYRCVSSEQDCVTVASEALAMSEDVASIERAIRCCDAMAGKRWSLLAAEPIGPLGGCVGVTMNIVVELPAL